MLKLLEDLVTPARERKSNPVEGSYTNKLLVGKSLAKEKVFNKKYTLMVFESHICKIDQLKWSKKETGTSWNGIGDFKGSNVRAASDQLWTTLPLDMISYKFEIDLSQESNNE